MQGEDRKEIIGWCIYCKREICEGEKYVVNENRDFLHKECDRLIEDNSDYFAR